MLITPEIVLLVSAIVVILLDLFLQRKSLLAVISLAGLAISFGCAVGLWCGNPQTTFNDMLTVDKFALFFKFLFLVISALVILASTDYVSKFTRFQGEYYALVLLSTLGMTLLTAATELITIFVALELISISLYALVGFLKDSKSTEASLKYMLLGAIASAILLYGMAFVFGFTGKTQLGDIAQAIGTLSLAGGSASFGLLLGLILLIVGFGFKIAAFPFQMWVPDVYEGAPTPITAYLSVASKAAGFAIILRIFYTAFDLPTWLSQDWGIIFAVLAAIGMTVGNIVAIPQVNIKRMLGYSSIAQAGYLMLGIATMGLSKSHDFLGQSSVIFFLAGYAVTNMGAFIAIIAISNKVGSDLIEDYAGVGKRSPLLALALTLCLISLTGIPLTAGFMGKFYIFSAAVQQNLLWLVIIAVLNSVISAYYYLRVVKVMWLDEPKFEGSVSSSGALRLALFLACFGVLLLGVIPNYVMKLAEWAAQMMGF
ncbi:MAG TPA: NADH-quinone oxidoreductase subunit N [Dehalococcoidales bacterium]